MSGEEVFVGGGGGVSGEEVFASLNSCKLFSVVLTVCPCENQAGGDTAQITDFPPNLAQMLSLASN